MLYARLAYNKIKDSLEPNKVIILYGPRRVGKTTLLNKLAATLDPNLLKKVNGEANEIKKILSENNTSDLKQFLGKCKYLLIDEAQNIPNIGKVLKYVVDTFEDISIVVTGSASFELANQIGEPLTGRKKTFYLYPLSFQEIIAKDGIENKDSILRNFLVFGGYPEVQNKANQNKISYLLETSESYLFKDILAFESVKNSQKLTDLLTLLAFQIGKEVSLSELGTQLALNRETVARYLDLLEKSFVIFNIRGYSRNLRKEVTKTSRYYFYDLGIRNSLISNFNPLNLRDDLGQLFENFIVMERIKRQEYEPIHSNNYFWRTYDQQEIDWIEERDGKLFGFEIKYNPLKKIKAPKSFMNTYTNATFEVVNSDNYLEFI